MKPEVKNIVTLLTIAHNQSRLITKKVAIHISNVKIIWRYTAHICIIFDKVYYFWS